MPLKGLNKLQTHAGQRTQSQEPVSSVTKASFHLHPSWHLRNAVLPRAGLEGQACQTVLTDWGSQEWGWEAAATYMVSTKGWQNRSLGKASLLQPSGLNLGSLWKVLHSHPGHPTPSAGKIKEMRRGPFPQMVLL